MKTIYVSMIIDHMGSNDFSAKEERAHYEKCLKTWLPGRQLKFNSDPATADIIVFDYGGLSSSNFTIMRDEARRFVNLIKDRPNLLVLVPSVFTYEHFLRSALEDEGMLWQTNVIIAPKMGVETEAMLPGSYLKSQIPEGWFLVEEGEK